MEVPEIMNVGIVGAGTIGAMLAFRLATFGKEVYVYDVSARAVQHSIGLNATWVTERTGTGVLTRDEASQILSRLHPCATLGDCVGMAELVIEAAPEKLEIKRQVFAEIDHLAEKLDAENLETVAAPGEGDDPPRVKPKPPGRGFSF